MSSTLDLTAAQRLFYGGTEAAELWRNGVRLWQRPDVTPPPVGGPPVTAGLVARWEADVGIVLDVDGQSVLEWQDLTGNGFDLPGRGTRPKLMAGRAPSGAAAVVFDGSGDVYGDTFAGLPSGASDRTMYLVANYHVWSNAYAGAAYGVPSTNQTFGLVATGASTNRLAVQGWSSGDKTSAIDALAQPWLVQSVVVASTAMRHFLDGAQIDAATRTYATPATGQRIALGVNLGGGSSTRRVMDICAVLIFDRALSDAEREEVRAYLQAKYLTPPA